MKAKLKSDFMKEKGWGEGRRKERTKEARSGEREERSSKCSIRLGLWELTVRQRICAPWGFGMFSWSITL